MYKKYYKILIKFLFGLLVFFICTCLGLILFYSEVYEFIIKNKFRMTGRKRKRSSKPKSDNMYKLQVYKFTKLYATDSNNKGPKARSGHRIVCKNSALYAIGGYNPAVQVDHLREENLLFREVWRFDFITRTWKKLDFERLPNELASSAAVLSGNLLFLYGGTGIPFGSKFNDKVYICKLEDYNSTLLFNPLNTFGDNFPKEQYGQSVAINETYLYTVGGTDGFKYSMDVYRLNLKTNIWEKLFDQDEGHDCPHPRYRHEIIFYQDHLYVLGGGTSNTAYDLQDIPAFKLKNNEWITVKTLGDDSISPNSLAYPASRRCHGCVQDPCDSSIVFVNGGYNERQVFKDTWRLDLKTLRWKCISSLNLTHGTYFHSASATPDGRMIVFGGITSERTPHQRTADVYSAWIRVPKLSDACWEALGFYVRKNIIKLPQNLKSLELPTYYETRLKTSYSFLDK